MTHIGIDLEQFVTDPYGSGIQRVLQYLALAWPSELATAEFVVPYRDEFLLLTPEQAAELVGIPFTSDACLDIRLAIAQHVEQVAERVPRIRTGALLSCFGAWLLPEVSYLPGVLDRFELFSAAMPTAMIGYDALPMTDPSNYRFAPVSGLQVSRYFRLLATCDAVACISDYSRGAILDRLRRDRSSVTTVAHPGGDHVPVRSVISSTSHGPVRFLRVGTMEARKMPVQIAEAFLAAQALGASASLTFIGKPSGSDSSINQAIRRMTDSDVGIDWLTDATDADVLRHLRASDVFLSLGVEGYGIPVLEAIRQGVPVLCGGIQPAADLMMDRGATRIDELSVEGLTRMFVEFSQPARLAELHESLEPEAVPRWSQFTHEVVGTVLA